MPLTLTAGNLQWLGIKKEAVPGTAETAPTIFIPIDSPKWGAKVSTLADTALRGFMGTDFMQMQSTRHDEVSYKTYMYPNAAFTHLRAILGGADTVTGVADPYSHKVSLLNTTAVPTYTLFIAMGDGNTMRVPGAVLSGVKVSVKANELPSLDISWTGLPATIVASPTNTPSTEAPMPPYTAAITVAGANLGKYTDLSLDFKRGVQPVQTLSGSIGPDSIYAGQLSVSGSMTAVFSGTSDSDLTAFLANTQPILSINVNPQGDAVHTLNITASKIAYDSVDPQGSSTSYMTVASSFKALLNTTDATDGKQSPASVTLKNTAATVL